MLLLLLHALRLPKYTPADDSGVFAVLENHAT